MRLINKDTDYAITALCYIAQRGGAAISASDLANELEISYTFLRKIFHTLRRHDIVRSRKGKGGGFELFRTADKIRVSEIMEIFQGRLTVGNCITSAKVCRHLRDCQLRRRLQSIKRNIESELHGITIESLISDAEA